MTIAQYLNGSPGAYSVDWGNAQDQKTYQNLTTETIQAFGQGMVYVYKDRKDSTTDGILGEYKDTYFSQYSDIKMWVDSVDSFEGESAYFSKFGLEFKDEAILQVSKPDFTNVYKTAHPTTTKPDNEIRPLEGDLIYHPLTKRFFEVNYVDYEKPFYPVQSLPAYTLNVNMFKFNDEVLRTGNWAVDSLASPVVYDFVVASVTGFSTGEKITFKKSAADVFSGIVRSITTATKTIKIYAIDQTDTNVSDDWPDSTYTINSPTSSTAITTAPPKPTGEKLLQTDTDTQLGQLFDNDKYESQGDQLVDFSADNPFGGI